MGLFPKSGVWINQDNQQPPKGQGESKRSENVRSKQTAAESITHEEREETKKQLKLWRDQEKKSPWHDWPPKATMKKTEKGENLLSLRFRVGLPPETVFDIFNSHDNQTYSYFPIIKRPNNLQNVSKKVLSDRGPKERIVKVEKFAGWKFLWWSGTIPIPLSFNEDRSEFTTIYTTSGKNIMHMKIFFGRFKVEPWYVNNDRYCKPRLPNSREEYKKCTVGKGLVGSKVTLEQIFEPLFPLNLPPVSWLIRGLVVKNLKTLMENIQIRGAVLRSV